MRAKIVGLVQIKGGCGRSTIATNMAGELSRVGNVALVDCDMLRGTSASWSATRGKVRPSNRFQFTTAGSRRELVETIERLRDTTDYIVLDAPPRDEKIAKAVLTMSDLTLVPVGASTAEIWATSDMLSLIWQAKKIRNIYVRMVWTQFRSYARLTQELAAEAHKALRLPVFKSALGYRAAYAEALGQGLTAAELQDATARDEVIRLVVELKRRLK